MNLRFENDVKTYSIQTNQLKYIAESEFENDVKTYSIQTRHVRHTGYHGLRMM